LWWFGVFLCGVALSSPDSSNTSRCKLRAMFWHAGSVSSYTSSQSSSRFWAIMCRQHTQAVVVHCCILTLVHFVV
jgi:hypothetical protein